MALTAKQQRFIDEYLVHFNATRAAINAGYSEKTARAIGCENLTKPDIMIAIKQHLEESAMMAEEVLMRLANQARGDIGDFAHIENSYDLANHPNSQIVKKFKKRTYRINDNPVEEVELELYDAHAALVDIGRKYDLFSDNINLKLKDELSKALDALEQELEPELFAKVISIIAK